MHITINELKSKNSRKSQIRLDEGWFYLGQIMKFSNNYDLRNHYHKPEKKYSN